MGAQTRFPNSVFGDPSARAHVDRADGRTIRLFTPGIQETRYFPARTSRVLNVSAAFKQRRRSYTRMAAAILPESGQIAHEITYRTNPVTYPALKVAPHSSFVRGRPRLGGLHWWPLGSPRSRTRTSWSDPLSNDLKPAEHSCSGDEARRSYL